MGALPSRRAMQPTDHTAVLRILDAALNRASEGLRVVEDYVRFALDDRHLTELAKSLRHDLAAIAAGIASVDRHTARDTQGDVGTAVETESEAARANAWHVCAASLKRVEQSLRSLEEFGKLYHPDLTRECEALRYRTYTLEKAIDLTRDSIRRLDGVRLYVLVDAQSPPANLERLVQSLVAAGVGAIQLRAKQLDDRALVEQARVLVTATRGTDTLAIINDRPDIAAVVHADGVHLGQEDLSVKEARAIVGPQALIGVSTHSIEQARAAVLAGANYLGAGPTFPSATKSFDVFPGLDFLKQVAAEIRLPTFAIGGIDRQNLPSVLETGITRIAVSSAVTSASNHSQVALELLQLLSFNHSTTENTAGP